MLPSAVGLDIAITHQKISSTQGGFAGVLDDGDWFGHSVAFISDLDGDGVSDLAVGAIFDDDGGPDRGAVYILFLNTDGTVKSHTKISDTQGGFTGGLPWERRSRQSFRGGETGQLTAVTLCAP
ncbi:hypothetical protein EMIHUDRAFT_212898 [Emiliania huxleyi CCMP1516]|uniref:Uncharacterized protein n=2 Tax=Emiliania huxleyi TaxID=2903 RepID=A0A0D3IPG9_EMIH1|nr:hypothetical protein EMIHUDRAFT_212898 [Emiliania huxleyi CCMP1516]EOD13154.1 hypothetical protein EMIHUDRAFT_212898 [Emiliania huxleyi CCMP1516]|eukprot:XP_005765583.1 hypothetical protein EMIHUDRAFT_212898 [Emiliania huxleyi CCMP1516]